MSLSDGQVRVWLLDPSEQQHGASWMPNISDWPNDAVVCSLSSVLETGPIPRKYFLSSKACAGILRRAEKRGKQLPELLARALKAVAASEQTSTSGGGYSLSPALTSSGRGTSRTGESRGQDCVVPMVCGTIAASGAGTDRPAGQHNELDFLIPSTGDISHCLNAGGMGRIDYETETLIAFDTTQVASALNRSNPKPGEPCHPIAAGAHPPSVAFNLRGRESGSQPEFSDVASLRAASGGSSRSYVATHAVRRLTPLECERLQGFVDDYTAIEGAADGPRYKALGNSMAVPVIRWICNRIRERVA